MATTKFSEADREKLFAQLEVPFDPAQVKWRVMRTLERWTHGSDSSVRRSARLYGPAQRTLHAVGMDCEYTIRLCRRLTRVEKGKVIVTSKMLGCERRDHQPSWQPHRHWRKVG